MIPKRPTYATSQDTSFFQRLEHFAYEQVPQDSAIDDRTRALTMLSVLAGMGAVAEFERVLPTALELGLEAEAAKEIVYQSAAYLGTGRALPLLEAANGVLCEMGIEVSEVEAGPTVLEERRKQGTAAQMQLWGEGVAEFYKVDTKNFWVTTHIFGDYYTRGGLSVAERALVTFCFLYAMGGVEHELGGYVLGNMGVGYSIELLSEVVRQNIPYVGFPRSLSALGVLADVAKK